MQLRSPITSHDEVEQWWRHIKARHQLFFHLINGKAPSEQKLKNVNGFIEQLQHSHSQVEDTGCPNKAESIREHLLNAIQNLVESLERLRDRQSFVSDVRFDVAKVDFSMVQHTLLSQGIVD